MESMVAKTVAKYSRLNIFWYNAGIFIPGHIDLVQEADFDKQVSINLKGAVFGTKFAIREMRKEGNGCVLFTSSMVGLKPNPYETVISAVL